MELFDVVKDSYGGTTRDGDVVYHQREHNRNTAIINAILLYASVQTI